MPRARLDRANIFMAASWTGLGALGITAAAAFADARLAITVPGLLLVIGTSYVMCATRRADEYTEGLWNAGASVAFGTMLLTFLGLPIAEGLIDGLRGAAPQQDIPAQIIPILAIAGFYIGLFVKRLLGDR